MLKTLICCVSHESINKLNNSESIIVIADALCNRSDYEPLIVTDMVDSVYEIAKGYYKKDNIEDVVKIPFPILNLEESISFLRGRYPVQYKSVMDRNTVYNII